MPEPTAADRLALAACPFQVKCNRPCLDCRRDAAAVSHEIAAILRERHGGSSTTADWLDGVGQHQGEG